MPAQAVLTAKISWLILTFAIGAITTGKASVAFLILRFLGPSRWRKLFLYAVSILGFILGGLAIIIIYSQCQPTRALWDPPEGRCPILVATNNFHVFVSSMEKRSQTPLSIGADDTWRLLCLCRSCPCAHSDYDHLKASVEYKDEGRIKCVSGFRCLVR